jgi:hypothetical protein
MVGWQIYSFLKYYLLKPGEEKLLKIDVKIIENYG